MQDFKLPKQSEAIGLPFYFLFASVYIFILVFFILVSTIAAKDAKTAKAAVGSLNKQFGKELAQNSTDPNADLKFIKEIFSKDIKNIFTGSYNKFESYIGSDKSLQVFVPTNVFFEGESSSIIRISYIDILGKIANIIQYNKSKFDVNLDVMIGVNHEMLENDSKKELQLARLSQIDYYLRNSQINDKLETAISVGYEDKVKFKFHVLDKRIVD